MANDPDQIARIEAFLSENLSPARFKHVMGVRETTVDLAKRHGINADQAELAALLHDCAKERPDDELLALAKRHGLEVDGHEQPAFCQHLALLSKLFLEHKYVDYDMTPFVFYVLCVIVPTGCQVAAYFSKEKRSPDNYNLSCILSLPQYQGKGYGRFLVEMPTRCQSAKESSVLQSAR